MGPHERQRTGGELGAVGWREGDESRVEMFLEEQRKTLELKGCWLAMEDEGGLTRW